MIEKTCCIAGHRDIPADKIEEIKAKLTQEIEAAIHDGYTNFISDYAAGTDLLFVSLIIQKKNENANLYLEASFPYPKFQKTIASKYLDACDGIRVQQEKYTYESHMNNRRYMIQSSKRMIAVYDGRESGRTAFAMKYAHTLGCEICVIDI